ncbi:MAG: hypothetical protein ACR2LM_10700 [Pyrinomonadaceae bacterium]
MPTKEFKRTALQTATVLQFKPRGENPPTLVFAANGSICMEVEMASESALGTKLSALGTKLAKEVCATIERN